MSTQCLPSGLRFSSIPTILVLTLDISACPAAKRNHPLRLRPERLAAVATRCQTLPYCTPSEAAVKALRNEPENELILRYLKAHQRPRWHRYSSNHVFLPNALGCWLKQGSAASVSTFYERQIAINRPCLVTVSHVKRVFLPLGVRLCVCSPRGS